jgi:hypothetical protein
VPTCSELAQALDDRGVGTGPQARGWLLVELPGAWPRTALDASRAGPEVAAWLERAGDTPGLRVQAIRRPGPLGGPAPGATTRTVVLAHAGPAPWLEVRADTTDADLLALDPGVCTGPEPPGFGVAVPGPLVLVCTHASRDRCCATLGRPIAATLATLHPETTWEVSHIGGHRFAGNLLVLPEGLAYGGLDVASAVEVVEAHAAGRVDPAHLRGRSALPRAAQAAEVLVRERVGAVHLGAVTDVVIATEQRAPEGATDTEVALRIGGRRHRATVRWLPTGMPRLVSCDATEAEDPGAYELLTLLDVEAEAER